ncbi:MAG TPA: SDR family oxidoreductase [Gemmatimonadaceae bacterium]|nr:SDR family oxidoreductase [Gemmatimonadaceae bacterium]
MAAMDRVLVAGATGMLGGVVARKLLAAGVPVRALGRNHERLDALAAAGAEISATDLLDAPAVARACEGIGQIFSTANNVMGAGSSSPMRVDVRAYRNLCAAAKAAGVRRIVHCSARDIGPDSPVDYFRVKHQVDEVIRQSGLPYVLIRPVAFMDIWIDGILAEGIRKNGTAILFGDGTRRSCYIAVDDVAEFAVRILAREDVRNEEVDVGGPSTVSYLELVSLLERSMGVPVKRKHVPTFMLHYVPLVIRPFNELAARLMRLGYFSALRDRVFPEWQASAERFGVSPGTVEAFVQERYGKGSQGAPRAV